MPGPAAVDFRGAGHYITRTAYVVSMLAAGKDGLGSCDDRRGA